MPSCPAPSVENIWRMLERQEQGRRHQSHDSCLAYYMGDSTFEDECAAIQSATFAQAKRLGRHKRAASESSTLALLDLSMDCPLASDRLLDILANLSALSTDDAADTSLSITTPTLIAAPKSILCARGGSSTPLSSVRIKLPSLTDLLKASVQGVVTSDSCHTLASLASSTVSMHGWDSSSTVGMPSSLWRDSRLVAIERARRRTLHMLDPSPSQVRLTEAPPPAPPSPPPLAPSALAWQRQCEQAACAARGRGWDDRHIEAMLQFIHSDGPAARELVVALLGKDDPPAYSQAHRARGSSLIAPMPGFGVAALFRSVRSKMNKAAHKPA